MTKEHVTEIFAVYGKIKNIEMLPDRIHTEYSRLFAYVDYEKPEDAEAAVDHMDGGSISFLILLCAVTRVTKKC